MKEAFARKFAESVAQRRASGVRYERIAVDLDITMGTLHNWRHAKTANIDLDTLQRVIDYFEWDAADLLRYRPEES